MNKKKDFWNNRALLGEKAGSNDLIAKQLEIQAITSYIDSCETILDFGCGNGITIVELDKKVNAEIVGIDFSPKMIEEARKNTINCKNKITLIEGDHTILKTLNMQFDFIYSERSIINIDTWEEQKNAILCLLSKLKKNGKYIMCEANYDALANINDYRKLLGLEKIEHPWHNKYIYNSEIESLILDGVDIMEINHFSSLYYFLSRIVNASVAKNESKEPNYNSFINNLALELPSFGDFSQSKIWVLKNYG